MTRQQAPRARTSDDTAGAEVEVEESERPSKARRIRLACLRCQKRKIKVSSRLFSELLTGYGTLYTYDSANFWDCLQAAFISWSQPAVLKLCFPEYQCF